MRKMYLFSEPITYVIPSKDIVPPEEVDVLDISPATVCRESFSGLYYKAKVINKGT